MKIKNSLLIVLAALLSMALLIFACSSSEEESSSTMDLTESSICEETSEFLDMMSLLDFTGAIDTGSLVKGNFLKIDFAKIVSMDAATSCPVITYPTDEPTISGDTIIFPSPYTLTIDYGSGCDPGTGETYSGSLSLTLTNFTMSGDSISGSYSATANHFKTGASELNGSVSGTLNITIDLVTFEISGTATATFSNLSDGSTTVNGKLTVSIDLDENGFGWIQLTLDNFTTGGAKYSGTVKLTMNSETSYILDIDLTSSAGNIDVTITMTVDETDGSYTLNTNGAGTYKDLTIEITNLTIDTDSCDTEPTSGTIKWSDGTGDYVSVSFDGDCDGDADVSMNGAAATACSQ